MKHKWLVFVISLVVYLTFFPQLSYSVDKKTDPVPDEQQVASVQNADINDAGAGDFASEVQQDRTTLLSSWLHMLDDNEGDDVENSSVMAFAPQVPGDLARILKPAGGEKGALGVLNVIFRSILSICVGFFLVFAAKRMAQKKIVQFQQTAPPGNDGFARLWASILKNLPSLAGLLLLAISSTAIFLLLAGNITTEGRMLFQFIFGTLLIIMIFSVIGRIIFAPEDAAIRSLQFDDLLVKPLYRTFVASTALLFSAKLFIIFIRGLGGLDQTISWVIIILGTAFLAVLASLVLYLKKPVSQSLQAAIDRDNSNWFKELFYTFFLSGLSGVVGKWPG